MKAEIIHALTDQLVHLGAMQREAEIMATQADNTLPAGATFAEAFDYVKTHFEI